LRDYFVKIQVFFFFGKIEISALEILHQNSFSTP